MSKCAKCRRSSQLECADCNAEVCDVCVSTCPLCGHSYCCVHDCGVCTLCKSKKAKDGLCSYCRERLTRLHAAIRVLKSDPDDADAIDELDGAVEDIDIVSGAKAERIEQFIRDEGFPLAS